MKTIEEKSRSIPVMAETDVLVVGSGPGGLSAALASSREGVETMLVERYGCFGGNITQAMVEPIAWYRHEKTVDAGGIGVEFERKAKEMGGTRNDLESLGRIPDPGEEIPDWVGQLLDADMFKYVADKMVLEAGVVPLLHCLVVDSIMEGDTIRGIVTESKSGRQAILAKRVIDATGDADVAFLAGAPYRKDPKDQLMGVSVSFGCSGVDVERLLEYTKEHPASLGDWAKETAGKENDLFYTKTGDAFTRAAKAGEIPEGVLKGGPWWHSLTEAGEATYINSVHMRGKDPTDIWDLTHSEMEGRQRVMWAIAAMNKYTPGFEKAKLRSFGSSLGTRESRKIIGEYTITEQDIKNETRFQDSIGIFPEFLDGYGVVFIPTTGRYFQVPYGITLPKKVENLLVAGRCVAGDKISHAATRQMMCCAVTGQGVGVASAVSIKDNSTCRKVDISKVQKALEKQGVRIR
ncbi:MAG: FAD-dependent oxidoreductase [Proteobacteria bacterium]|nr:FAD-dependent oxidoreductase [Pseudomonadota bacterium]